MCLNRLQVISFFMNWMRFTNCLFGVKVQINEHDRVQFETNEPCMVNHSLCAVV